MKIGVKAQVAKVEENVQKDYKLVQPKVVRYQKGVTS